VADWPLTTDLGPVGALPTAPSLARGFVATVLWLWGLSDLAETAELLVSELATNVVQAAAGEDGVPRYDGDEKLPVLWIRLLYDRARLMLEVWDSLPAALGTPQVHHPGLDEESGRGLELIDALAEDWGWETVPEWQGKRVWVILPTPA
jgi:anti-sigma regulatory factor (Ser/Thr protein kinase)